MLVLPIINKNRVMNVEVKIKNASKVRTGVCYDDADESEIIVSQANFSESSFYPSRDVSAPVDFIRSRSILYPRDFIITTKHRVNSELYDVYLVKQPPKKVNDSLDRLYGKALLDLKNEIPEVVSRGRYLSLEELGIGDELTDDKIAKLQHIVKEERDTSKWPELFQKEGIADLEETLQFLRNFDCTLISDISLPVDQIQGIIDLMGVVHTRDYRNIKRYYDIAHSNTKIYTRLAYIHKVMYQKPFAWIRLANDSKMLIKKMDE